jgi:hypothetical protein
VLEASVIEIGHLVEEGVHPALGARAVVPDDVENQRVVELTEIFECRDQSADLNIGVFPEAREDLHLAREQALFICAQPIPILDGIRLWGELRFSSDDAKRFLTRKRLITQFVPSLVELSLVLGDPLFRHVVRSVSRAGREVDEERAWTGRSGGLRGAPTFY